MFQEIAVCLARFKVCVTHIDLLQIKASPKCWLLWLTHWHVEPNFVQAAPALQFAGAVPSLLRIGTLTRLPKNLEGQLDIARLIALSTTLDDLTEGSVGRTVVISSRERRVIERIESIKPELRMEPLVKIEALR